MSKIDTDADFGMDMALRRGARRTEFSKLRAKAGLTLPEAELVLKSIVAPSTATKAVKLVPRGLRSIFSVRQPDSAFQLPVLLPSSASLTFLLELAAFG